MSSEKREFVRHPSSIPIEVRLLGRANRDVHIRDISMGGLAFPYHWPIAPGAPVAIYVPSLVDHIDLKGRVVHCQGKPPDWIIGVAFENSEDVFRMRIVEQICHIEAYRRQVLELEGRSISSDEAAAEWIPAHAAHFPRCRL